MAKLRSSRAKTPPPPGSGRQTPRTRTGVRAAGVQLFPPGLFPYRVYRRATDPNISEGGEQELEDPPRERPETAPTPAEQRVEPRPPRRSQAVGGLDRLTKEEEREKLRKRLHNIWQTGEIRDVSSPINYFDSARPPPTVPPGPYITRDEGEEYTSSEESSDEEGFLPPDPLDAPPAYETLPLNLPPHRRSPTPRNGAGAAGTVPPDGDLKKKG